MCQNVDLFTVRGNRFMATTNLILHRGAREVSREELALVPLPAPTKTWAPVGHQRVLDTALVTIQEAGFKLDKMKLGLSADGARFFGTLAISQLRSQRTVS